MREQDTKNRTHGRVAENCSERVPSLLSSGMEERDPI